MSGKIKFGREDMGSNLQNLNEAIVGNSPDVTKEALVESSPRDGDEVWVIFKDDGSNPSLTRLQVENTLVADRLRGILRINNGKKELHLESFNGYRFGGPRVVDISNDDDVKVATNIDPRDTLDQMH